MFNAITCITKLYKENDDDNIYNIYDHATKLTFKLDIPITQGCGLYIVLKARGAAEVVIFDDWIEINGDTFYIFTNVNFLDAMKEFSDSGKAKIQLCCDLDIGDDTVRSKNHLINPWHSK